MTERYDRQLRLWGDHGQHLLQNSHVCVVGSNAPATEILKSLVLPGIDSFTIVDDAKVTSEDLGHNFLLQPDSLGKSRCSEAVKCLLELNPNVKGHAVVVAPYAVQETSYQRVLDRSTVVITSCMTEKLNNILMEECRKRGIPLIVCSVYGFIAYVQIYLSAHVIMESHRENPPPDLRLDLPFDSLCSVVNSTDLDKMDHQQHSHTPFLFILFKGLEAWRERNNRQPTDLPMNFKEKKELKSLILAMRKADEKGRIDEQNFDEAVSAVNTAVHPTVVSDRVRSIMNDHCVTDQYMVGKGIKELDLKFWILVRSLKEFLSKHGVLPVKGSLPDMTADSARYVQLQTLFHKKAQSDIDEIHCTAESISKRLGLDLKLEHEMTQIFCKHANDLHVIKQNYTTSPTFIEVVKNAIDSDDVCMSWYVLLKAAEKFNASKGRYPGTNGIPVPLDTIDLANRVKALSEEWGIPDLVKKIGEDRLFEMCRYGACQPHVVSSFLGGCVSQEVIKLITHQYIPLNNTFIFDANSGNANTYTL